MTSSNDSAAIPVAVRKLVDEWITGAYGVEHLGVPMHLLEAVTSTGETTYRLEIDVTLVANSPHRETVSLTVRSRPTEVPLIDQDSVVFCS